MTSGLELYVTAHRQLRVQAADAGGVSSLPAAAAARIERAFSEGQGAGLIQLATGEVKTALPPGLAFARRFAQIYVTRLCHLGEGDAASYEAAAARGAELRGRAAAVGRVAAPDAAAALIEPPEESELQTLALEAPPIKGLEYLDAGVLGAVWADMDAYVRKDSRASGQSPRAWLHERNPLWRLVGRVTFHLAENKRDAAYPFAFLATYAAAVSERGEAQHLPLGRALQELAGTANRKRLVSLLTPIRDASERLEWVGELLESGDIYHPLAWTPAEAHRLLKDVPALEASGLVVRIPDWWKAGRAPRPAVRVSLGGQAPASLGASALLDFSTSLVLDGKPLTEVERKALLASPGGLMRLRGEWVEVDGERLAAALAHWKNVERDARAGALSFYEGMRLLAGAGDGDHPLEGLPETLREWSGIEPGEWLSELLVRLRQPEGEGELRTAGLQATLRPYQAVGAKWLGLLTGLGLGACLADDMGLGKTIQVIALLLHLRAEASRRDAVPRTSTRTDSRAGSGPVRASRRSERSRHEASMGASSADRLPTLIVAPASLIANWRSELERFAPSLAVLVAHPSENALDLGSAQELEAALGGIEVALTTYGVVARSAALRERRWRLVVLDEAQAIKNPGAQQTRAVKQLVSPSRIALTGTPIENRLADLWSLFDFLNPGLLGDSRAFASAAKRLAKGNGGTAPSFAPLRRLVQPYILRRLKTDRRVIADLPEKTEVRAYCGLTREQAALYEQCVGELARALETTEGIRRRGAVLAHLMQLKQICNHPAQWSGQGGYAPARSGKFERLTSLCEELAERQERALVFTQFREITEPLAAHLGRVFGHPGLVLHGGTPVAKRQALVAEFQREDGPPFFVLSLKAGGTGLNLTAASQVIHFDRWWNPAVENQATDRAFRIGQRRNVLVHKLVCRGTVEEKIDALIEAKIGLARGLLEPEEGGERLLTEMTDEELLSTVALDIRRACA